MNTIKWGHSYLLSLFLCCLVPGLALGVDLNEIERQLRALSAQSDGTESVYPPCDVISSSIVCTVTGVQIKETHYVVISPERLTIAARSSLKNNELGRNSSSNITLEYSSIPSDFSAGFLLGDLHRYTWYDVVGGALLLVSESKYLFALVQSESLVVVTNIRSGAGKADNEKAQFLVVEGREQIDRAQSLLLPAILSAPNMTVMNNSW